MKISDFTTKQQVWAGILVGGIAIAGLIMKDPEPAKAETALKAPSEVTVLEKWEYGPDAKNIAILIYDWAGLTEKSAKEIAYKQCGGPCAMAYFYSSQEAYDLHAVKRTKFSNPEIEFGGDMKKMVKEEEKWKKADNHWITIQKNLIATVSGDEFESFPYKKD